MANLQRISEYDAIFKQLWVISAPYKFSIKSRSETAENA